MAPVRQNGISARPEDRAHLQAVAREEPLGRQHAERVDVVVALGLPAPAAIDPFEPLHETVAAAEERLVLGIQRALLDALLRSGA